MAAGLKDGKNHCTGSNSGKKVDTEKVDNIVGNAKTREGRRTQRDGQNGVTEVAANAEIDCRHNDNTAKGSSGH